MTTRSTRVLRITIYFALFKKYHPSGSQLGHERAEVMQMHMFLRASGCKLQGAAASTKKLKTAP